MYTPTISTLSRTSSRESVLSEHSVGSTSSTQQRRPSKLPLPISRQKKATHGSTPAKIEYGEIVWSWEKERGYFEPFMPEACRLIEKAFNNNQENVLVWGTSGNSYFIDMKNKDDMFQFNETTNFRRRVKRG